MKINSMDIFKNLNLSTLRWLVKPVGGVQFYDITAPVWRKIVSGRLRCCRRILECYQLSIINTNDDYKRADVLIKAFFVAQW